MNYKVYKMEQGQQDELWEKERFPDFSKLTPQKQGSFETGWLDPKLAEMEDNFSMVFEGRLDMNASNSLRVIIPYVWNILKLEGLNHYLHGGQGQIW